MRANHFFSLCYLVLDYFPSPFPLLGVLDHLTNILFCVHFLQFVQMSRALYAFGLLALVAAVSGAFSDCAAPDVERRPRFHFSLSARLCRRLGQQWGEVRIVGAIGYESITGWAYLSTVAGVRRLLRIHLFWAFCALFLLASGDVFLASE